MALRNLKSAAFCAVLAAVSAVDAFVVSAGLTPSETISAADPGAAPTAPATATLPSHSPDLLVPKIDFKQFTLDNGLAVYTVEDHTSPTVAVQVWYHVGSKDDPPGRSGFAHLFEHMMFKGNEHLKPQMFEDLTENIGGQNNAFTQDDVTVYHEVVPSHYLEPLLWAEAERMSSLAVTDENFASERDVVKEEYRQRVAANPYGEFSQLISKLSFAAHPYKRPGIGNIDELNASKLSEVQAFHSTFYRPDNATLIIVGDFQTDELDGWVRKYFGAIKNPAEAVPRVSVKEPPRKADHIEKVYSSKVPLGALAVTYLGPAARSEDSPALDVVEAILAEGQSSRLYQALVYQQRIAQVADCNMDEREDLGLLTFRVILASGKQIEQAEKALDDQIRGLLKNGVTEAELAKAKSSFITGKLFERETNNGKASALGAAAVIYGDANRVNTDISKLQAVTAQQVKDVLNKYIAGQKKVVIEFLPEAAKPQETPGKEP